MIQMLDAKKKPTFKLWTSTVYSDWKRNHAEMKFLIISNEFSVFSLNCRKRNTVKQCLEHDWMEVKNCIKSVAVYFFKYFSDGLSDCLTDGLTDWLTDWLTDGLADYRTGGMTDLVNEWIN